MNTAAGEREDWSAVRLTLGRHQRRRAQGIPTLGVLVGTPAAAVSAWEDWTTTAGWHASVREVHLRADLADGPFFEAGSQGEAVLYLHRLPGDAAATPLPGSVLASLVDRLCRALDKAGADAASCPRALVVDPVDAAAFLRDEPYTRARTLFAEGMVPLLTVAPSHESREVPSDRVVTEDAIALAAPSLAKRSWRAATVASFAAAAGTLRRVESTGAQVDEAERARSAAERFLFDLLGELPETQGVFALNVRLDFCFGPMRAEVDLFAAGLRLAVEIDGYHHFRDEDGYRRDRRKDALLQRQGYLVLRFLAADVVTRLEDILEEIRAAVAFRRATLS